MYRPTTSDGPLPAHVFMHAGDFWSGSILQVEPVARALASAVGCAVLSVGYRLAPEHPWPAAPEDCYAALQWAVTNAAELGIDARRVSIGGVSAGACLAAVVALMARDRGGPPLLFQLLEIPVIDLTMNQPSMTKFATGYIVTRDELAEGYGYYAPDASDRMHPHASPLFAEDLADLPPAAVLTCEFDPLRDEGEAYARRLREAGVPVQTIRAKGHIHGSTYSAAWYARSGRRYREMTMDALRSAYRRAPEDIDPPS